MYIREKCFNLIKSIFKQHGAVGIDTPVFEMRNTLMGKYGEDSKLIFDLADQGGEQYSLRYDLTVPFARYIGSKRIKQIKRYHIAKVYRRDNPAPQSGRFREFYQCDFDIAGHYPLMIADSEVLCVLIDILKALQIGHFQVKLSHRKLLDALMNIAGVPTLKFRTICSAVDKLDKLSWSQVKHEMIYEKGLNEQVADKIGQYVTQNFQQFTPFQLLTLLQQDKELSAHPQAKEAFQELTLLFQYLEAFNVLSYISFDLSLARGLDYYTGLIYEAVIVADVNDSSVIKKVGSIAAGGRYDNLVGMFSAEQVPSVGVSIGIERVLAIMEARYKQQQAQTKDIDVYIACRNKTANTLVTRMKLAALLWSNSFKTEFSYHLKPKAKDEIQYCNVNQIPIMIFVGHDDPIQQQDQPFDTFNIKNLITSKQIDQVAYQDIISVVKQLLADQSS